MDLKQRLNATMVFQRRQAIIKHKERIKVWLDMFETAIYDYVNNLDMDTYEPNHFIYCENTLGGQTEKDFKQFMEKTCEEFSTATHTYRIFDTLVDGQLCIILESVKEDE